MKIGWVAPVKPSHPYLENGPAPLFDLHYLRISPWLWFSGERIRPASTPRGGRPNTGSYPARDRTVYLGAWRCSEGRHLRPARRRTKTLGFHGSWGYWQLVGDNMDRKTALSTRHFQIMGEVRWLASSNYQAISHLR